MCTEALFLRKREKKLFFLEFFSPIWSNVTNSVEGSASCLQPGHLIWSLGKVVSVVWWCSMVLSKHGVHITQSHALCWRNSFPGRSSMQMTQVWYSNVLTSELDVTPSVVEISGTTASSLKRSKIFVKLSISVAN